MRYISTELLKAGMVLALPFYSSNFEIMLGGGTKLEASHIKKINELGYQGMYIDDEISKFLNPIDVVPTELRIRTIRAAKDILQQAKKNSDIIKLTRENQNKIIMPVIEAIIANPRRLVDMIDIKPFDDYMFYHTANVVILSLLVGIEMGISGLQLYELGMSALLHDVGNMFMPKELLDKTDVLEPSEYELLKTHSQMGFEYLREHFDLTIEACMGALQHHENYDGTGYPTGLKKEKISIYGRIIAVTDVYDALTSRRPFRNPVYPVSAMDFMEAGAGTKFDPNILKALQNVIALYPLGCCVELDTGARGIVIENFIGDTARPRIRLFDDLPYSLTLNLHEDRVCSQISVADVIEI